MCRIESKIYSRLSVEMGGLCSSTATVTTVTTVTAVTDAPTVVTVETVDLSGQDLSMNLVTLSVQVEDLSQQAQAALLQSATEKLAEATIAINAAASLGPTDPVTETIATISTISTTAKTATTVTVESSNVARDIQQYKESSGISVKE